MSSPSVVAYTAAKPADAAALSAFFKSILPLTYPPDFYALALSAPAFTVRLAVSGGRLVGAAVVKALDLAEARASGSLPFDLLSAPPAPGAHAACVLLLAVGPTHRRMGVGSQLLTEALSAAAAAAAAPLCAAFLMCRAGDAAARAFYCGGCALPFEALGVWPGHYELPGGREDAAVLVLPLRGAELAEFERGAGAAAGAGVEVNLLDAKLKRRARMPAWQRDLLFHYVLPMGAVALLFAVSYLLVLLGPLKGISGTHQAPVAQHAAAPRGATGSHEL